MDAVLGLSVTPSAVGLVLVDGQNAEGIAMDEAMDSQGFEVGAGGSSSAVATSEQAAAAVLRTEAMATECGHRVQSIGVTWSDDADTEASLLLKSLSDSGFDNIVPVRLSEATDALARGIAEVTGYRTTAVCVIEPGQLIAMVVHTDDGALQTAVNHSVVTEEDLVGWLSSVFTRADWEPEALVLVGSAEDLDGLLPVLEDALAVPVFSPAEAQLALARGAALACAQAGDFVAWENGDYAAEDTSSGHGAARRLSRVGPTALLLAGLVTFVASVSVALGLQFVPDRPGPFPRAAAAPAAPAPKAPVSPPLAAPVRDPAPPPAFEAPDVPAPEAPPVPEVAPVVDAALPEPEVPAAPPVLDVPQDPPAAPAAPAALPPRALVPPPVPQEERRGILQRIRDRLSGGGNDEPLPAVAPPPPPPVVPPLP